MVLTRCEAFEGMADDLDGLRQLDGQVADYVRLGYRVAERTPTTARLVRPKKFWEDKDQVVTLTLRDDGAVEHRPG
jgi:hypothetical protein